MSNKSSENPRMGIHDISMPLTPDVAVFPGDTPPTRELLLDMQQGAHLTLSTLHSTVHLGTHIDGPCHYVKDGAGVETMPLSLGYGTALLIDAPGDGPVPASVLPDGDLPPRLLVRTRSYPDPTVFEPKYRSLSPEFMDAIAGRGVQLIGVDTPSIDAADAKVLVAHHRAGIHGLWILEQLRLDAISTGLWHLIAFPLPLAGYDASPVRAVLIGPPVR